MRYYTLTFTSSLAQPWRTAVRDDNWPIATAIVSTLTILLLAVMLALGEPWDLSVAAAFAYAGFAGLALFLGSSDTISGGAETGADAASPVVTSLDAGEVVAALSETSSERGCTRCRTENDRDAKYCKSCGHLLTAAI